MLKDLIFLLQRVSFVLQLRVKSQLLALLLVQDSISSLCCIPKEMSFCKEALTLPIPIFGVEW